MSVNINPNYDPNIPSNELFNTQIPALSENANIQEALRLYHYGVGTGVPTTNSQIQEQSVAGHFKKIKTDIATLQNKGLGSSYVSAEPTAVDNGYIWVDADSAAPIFGTPPATIPSVARYQNAAPTTNVADGMIWIDKDDQSKTTYVYDNSTSTWLKTGDVVKYQVSQPATTNILEGTIWIDKDSSPLKMYVYDATLGWREVGA